MPSSELNPLLGGASFSDHLKDSNVNDISSNSHSLGRNNDGDGNGSVHLHMKTYTAGEGASRLASAAKALGLAHQRSRRPQVRGVVRRVLLPAMAGLTEELRHKERTMRILQDEEDGQEETSDSSIYDLLAGVAGNVLEWYDFAVFGYFGDIIGQVFFPPQAGDAATVESFAVFGGAFLMRPIGGLLLGVLGDMYHMVANKR